MMTLIHIDYELFVVKMDYFQGIGIFTMIY